MTDEQLQTIQLVIKKLAGSNTFGFYEVEDIEQEAFLICVSILDKWDGIRPLENFLTASLGKRLKSFRRDNYYRHNSLNESLEKRKRASIDLVEETDTDDPRIEIRDSDEVDKVLRELPPSLRSDFLRLANGVSLSVTRKAAVYSKVKEILSEDG